MSNTNITTDVGLSDEMKTYYSEYLIRAAEPEYVHNQFAQKRPIPKHGGKTVEFRKPGSLPKALTPLSEGVTPDGQKINWSSLTATVGQYGGYVELSDMLEMSAVDDNLKEATRMIADQAAKTLDTLTREVLAGGTNVQYGEGGKLYRYELVGGADEGNDYLTVDAIRKAVRWLKVQNAKRIKGDFVGIIHPDCAYDLMSDPKWVNVKTYADPEGIYHGEIGKIEGVRFVESSEAKVFHAADLTDESRNLTAVSADGATITIAETLTDAQAANIVGRKVLLGGAQFTVTAAAGTTLTLDSAPDAVSENEPIYPGEAGAKGRDVYATLILGADAYGVTQLADGGLKHIAKQLGSAGTADPLDQRATCGWKATHAAVRLCENYMVRIETASTYEIGEN